MHSTATTTVAAPPSRVWAVLADHEAMSSWAPGLRVSLDETGSTDRNGVGAVRRISTPGPAPAIVERITEFEPERRLSYRALAGVPLKNYGGTVVLHQVEGGTRISYTISADERVPAVEKAMTAIIARTLLNGLTRAVKRS
jgi:Polyketide cyclase / dehydrase and lipid transport